MASGYLKPEHVGMDREIGEPDLGRMREDLICASLICGTAFDISIVSCVIAHKIDRIDSNLDANYVQAHDST